MMQHVPWPLSNSLTFCFGAWNWFKWHWY